MARENFLWGAPRIHGELLMRGFKVSQATVSRYMPSPIAARDNRGEHLFDFRRSPSLDKKICDSEQFPPYNQCAGGSIVEVRLLASQAWHLVAYPTREIISLLSMFGCWDRPILHELRHAWRHAHC